MKSRNGGLTRDSSASGMIHHAQTNAVAAAHQAPNPAHRRRSAGRNCSAHHSAPTDVAAIVATAFTAPINVIGTAARKPSRHSGAEVDDSPTTTPSRTQGASIMGSVSDEMEPIVVSTRGLSANTVPANRRDPGEPMSSASATRTIPMTPTASSTAHHSRCVIHGGRCRRWPRAKNAPCGKK